MSSLMPDKIYIYGGKKKKKIPNEYKHELRSYQDFMIHSIAKNWKNELFSNMHLYTIHPTSVESEPEITSDYRHLNTFY